MPRKSPITWAVKLLYCAVVMLTFPLMVYPAQKVIDSHVTDKWQQSPKKMIVENITRTLLVIFACVVALSVWNDIPHLNGLAGAIACCPMAFTLPALFHLKLGLAKTRTQKFLDVAMVIFSILITIFTTEEVFRTWTQVEVMSC